MQHVAFAADIDRDPGRLGMTADVGQGLLRDPERSPAHVRIGRVDGRVDANPSRQPCPAGEAMDEVAQGERQPVALKVGGIEQERQCPDLPLCLIDARPDAAQGRLDVRMLGGQHMSPGQAESGRSEVLGG